MNKLTYRLDGEKEENMNWVMIMAIICISIPTWQLVDKADKGQVGEASCAAVQIVALAILFSLMR